MTFNSWEFILFYPIVLLLYFVLPKRFKMPMLLLASYFFYMYYQPVLAVLIFGTTLVSWLASRYMEKTESSAKRKLALAAALVSSLGVLFFFKYFDFILGSIAGIASLFGAEPSFVELNLILPVGISFYTFQTLSYVIDVYRRDIKCEPSFFYYALFVSFFPQLVAGPIERPENLLPQLKKEPKWNRDSALLGAKFMLLGFFKKICIADLLATYVNTVYNNPTEASSLSVILATVFFALQIYCDFSGYTDIAIGCAEIMGIHLMKNFDHPYSATTITEFWSRWHISLSTWFRDYLYIPLGGNRRGKCRKLINLAIVFLVSGLWHGAAWTFVLWGALHAAYRVISELTIKPRNKMLARMGLSEDRTAVRTVRRINTFIITSFAWLFFRANSVSDVGILISKLFDFRLGFAETLEFMGIDLTAIILMLSSFAVLYVMDRLLTYGDKSGASGEITRSARFVFVLWGVALVWLLLLSEDKISSFIYFQF